MRRLIQQIAADGGIIPEDLIERDVRIEIFEKVKKTVVVSGFRRTGKTYLLFQTMKNLLNKNIDKRAIVYINFEDERLPRKKELLSELVPAIRELVPSGKIYLFLDEIQNIPEWSRWVRRINDTERGIFLFITGSSSRLSSMEIATELRGRTYHIQLFPLTFSEFLKFKNENIEIKNIRESEKSRLMILLKEYITFGGLPEIVLTQDRNKKAQIIKDYYNTMLNRDLIERFGIRNKEIMRFLLRLLVNSTSFTVSKMFNVLKSENYRIGKTTILNYINYIETSYFMHHLLMFSRSVKDELYYPRKCYFTDNFFISQLSTRFSDNFSRLMENAIAIELLRKTSENLDLAVFYWKDEKGREVDFIVKDGMRIKQLIQVCYDPGDYETRQREIKSLLLASKELRCNRLLVLTWDYENEESHGSRKIVYTPMWKWLLG